MELKRDIYVDLLNWKENHSKQVLLLEGCRQVGKTHIIKKFAREQYKRVIYINLSDDSGKRLLECYKKLYEDIRNNKININNNYLKELFKRYDDNFVDSSDTIIVIDEIQESYKVYNKIRGFSKELESHVVVTGSYLGRIVNNKEFWLLVGDVYTIQVYPLSFEEFLKAFDLFDVYLNLDFFGGSDEEDYEKISNMFSVYSVVGGYPEVVAKLEETGNIMECENIISNIIKTFCKELTKYFGDNSINVSIFNHILRSINKLLTNKKKVFKEDSFNEALQKVLSKGHYSNISKEVLNRAVSWLESANIIGYCNKIINCNINDFKVKQRCFFTDLGVATHLLNLLGVLNFDEISLRNEIFVFNCLARSENKTPSFSTLNKGELDFLVKSKYDSKLYGIQVKSSKNSEKTISDALRLNKIDYALYLKEGTFGGIDKEKKIITVPIYLFERFKFDIGERVLEHEINNIFKLLNVNDLKIALYE
ncbi:ATP-binding protein [Clostridium uliginosum]|uniref:AAA+ ATPase domain-containing protein n=1 Tax=Clostridium uliginosum TaxID=119641 RepID=A0A1I1RNR6_9CLOT|nr:AAA family ATPase [Clostridium uliginosum]SFD35677.1 hypothetical protein SAMN05421842_1366 [Clostridium uliginosum]